MPPLFCSKIYFVRNNRVAKGKCFLGNIAVSANLLGYEHSDRGKIRPTKN
jgi:hypothetical protein